MILNKEGTTTIVSQENISLKIFLENLLQTYPKIKADNLIINLFSFAKLTSNDLLEFVEIANQHKEENKSFVLVVNEVAYEDIPEEITAVPTVQEARDVIEMEEIERDLGI